MATPAVLTHYGVDPHRSTRPRCWSHHTPGSGHGRTPAGRWLGPDSQALNGPRIQAFAKLPTDASAPDLLVTERTVAALKIHVTPNAAWLIQAPQSAHSIKIDTARQLAVATGMTIETRSQAPSLATIRNDATSAGIVLILGMLAMTIGLIRSETGSELRTLAATGATARPSRRYRGRRGPRPARSRPRYGRCLPGDHRVLPDPFGERIAHPPILDLILILVGLRVLATARAVIRHRPPPVIARQPIE